MKYLKYLFIAVLFASCADDEDIQTNQEVVDYLNVVVDFMEQYSIERNEIDWVDFRNQVLEEGANAQSLEDTDEALLLALSLLDDNNSYFERPDGDVISAAAYLNCENSNISGISTPDNIEHLKFPPFDGNANGLNAKIAFAEIVQEEIQSRDNVNITGWIIDLRNNNSTGGISPLLAAGGPILGEGTAGYYVYPEFSSQEWSYEGGSAKINGTNVIEVSEPYELINQNPKVAIIINKATSSTAAALAIAFKGRPNTAIIGDDTCVPLLHNLNTVFSDFTYLRLAAANLADREGNVYQDEIVPDIYADDATAVQAAINYLNN